MLHIHRATTFRELIELIRQSRRKGSKVYSYRQLADRFGYRSPRAIAMVHHGQRAPSRLLVNRIVQALALTAPEAEIVVLLAQKAAAARNQAAAREIEEALERRRAQCEALRTQTGYDINSGAAIELYITKSDLQTVQRRLGTLVEELASEIQKGGKEIASYTLYVRLSVHD